MRRSAFWVFAGLLILLGILVLWQVTERNQYPNQEQAEEAESRSPIPRANADDPSADLERSAESTARRLSVDQTPNQISVLVRRLRVLTDLGQPVAGARVWVDGRLVGATDEIGGLELPTVSSRGEVALIVAPGFAPHVSRLAESRKQVFLRRDGGLQVHARWKDNGQPVSGALLSLHPTSSNTLPPWIESLLADGAGLPVQSDALGMAAFPWSCVTRVSNASALDVLLLHSEAEPNHVWRDSDLEPPMDRAHAINIEVERASEEEFLSLRLVDSRGRSLIGKNVGVHVRSNALFHQQTNEEGRIRVPSSLAEGYPDLESAPTIRVNLGDDRHWWARDANHVNEGEYTYVIDYRPVKVEIESVDAATLWVASASARSREEQDRVFGARPFPWSRLKWVPVPDEGRWILEQGWQGPGTCVLLKAGDADSLVDWQWVEEDRVVRFTRLRLAEVEFHLPDPQPNPSDETLVSVWLQSNSARTSRDHLSAAWWGNADLWMKASDLPVRVNLAYGRYQYAWSEGASQFTRHSFQVNAPEVSVPVLAPEYVLTPTRIFGTITGPLVGARIVSRLGMHENRVSGAGVRTDGFGRCWLPTPVGKSELRLRVEWPHFAANEMLREAWQYLEVDMRGKGELDIEIEEARLRLVQDSVSPLFKENSVLLQRFQSAKRRQETASQALVMPPGREAEWILPTGYYQVRFSVRGVEPFVEDFELASGEQKTLWMNPKLPSSGIRVELKSDFKIEGGYFSMHLKNVISGQELRLETGFSFINVPATQPHLFGVPDGTYEVDFDLSGRRGGENSRLQQSLETSISCLAGEIAVLAVTVNE